MKKIFLAMLMAVCLMSCQKVTGNPAEDADNLCTELMECANEGDMERAEKLIKEYNDYYKEQKPQVQLAFTTALFSDQRIYKAGMISLINSVGSDEEE